MKQLIRLPMVTEITGQPRSSIYELMEAGEFPKPVRINKRAVAWVRSEIDQWIDARIKERGPAIDQPRPQAGS